MYCPGFPRVSAFRGKIAFEALGRPGRPRLRFGGSSDCRNRAARSFSVGSTVDGKKRGTVHSIHHHPLSEIRFECTVPGFRHRVSATGFPPRVSATPGSIIEATLRSLRHRWLRRCFSVLIFENDRPWETWCRLAGTIGELVEEFEHGEISSSRAGRFSPGLLVGCDLAENRV